MGIPFFFDTSKAKLENLYSELKDHDYVLEDLNLMDDHEWRLYVCKIETLTPEILHKRNMAFNDLACLLVTAVGRSGSKSHER